MESQHKSLCCSHLYNEVKSEPTALQENLRALQARDAKKVREEEEEEEQERQEIISQGLNPDEVLTRRKRIRQFDRDKEYVNFAFTVLLSVSASLNKLCVHCAFGQK